MQQLQALLTLLWSALLLGEHVTLATVLAALAVIASVAWSQHGRQPGDASFSAGSQGRVPR